MLSGRGKCGLWRKNSRCVCVCVGGGGGGGGRLYMCVGVPCPLGKFENVNTMQTRNLITYHLSMPWW